MRKNSYCRVCDAPIKLGKICCGGVFCRTNLKRVLALQEKGSYYKEPVRYVVKSLKPLIKENNSVTLAVVSETIKPILKKEILPVNLKEKLQPSCNIVIRRKSSENYCLYCGNKFGSAIYFHKRVRILTLNKDHFIPIRRRQGTRTPDNINNKDQKIITSCQICNLVKGSKTFNSFLEAKHFILDQLLNSDWKLLV